MRVLTRRLHRLTVDSQKATDELAYVVEENVLAWRIVRLHEAGPAQARPLRRGQRAAAAAVDQVGRRRRADDAAHAGAGVDRAVHRAGGRAVAEQRVRRDDRQLRRLHHGDADADRTGQAAVRSLRLHHARAGGLRALADADRRTRRSNRAARTTPAARAARWRCAASRCATATTRRRRWTASTWTSRPANRWRWSAPRAPARPA